MLKSAKILGLRPTGYNMSYTELYPFLTGLVYAKPDYTKICNSFKTSLHCTPMGNM